MTIIAKKLTATSLTAASPRATGNPVLYVKVNDSSYEPDDTGTVNIGKATRQIKLNGTTLRPDITTDITDLGNLATIEAQNKTITWADLASTKAKGIFGNVAYGDLNLTIGGDTANPDGDYTIQPEVVCAGNLYIQTTDAASTNNNARTITISRISCGRLDIRRFRATRIYVERNTNSSCIVINGNYLRTSQQIAYEMKCAGLVYIGSTTFESTTLFKPFIQIYNARVFYTTTAIPDLTGTVVSLYEGATFTTSINMTLNAASFALGDKTGTAIVYGKQIVPTF